MITGVVTDGREAIVQARVRGPQAVEQVMDAVLDTGFTEEISLPQARVDALGLPLIELDEVTLADDSTIEVGLYEGTVLWDGQERRVIVHCLEGTPLIGMSLIYAYLLTMQVMAGGRVTLVPLAEEVRQPESSGSPSGQ